MRMSAVARLRNSMPKENSKTQKEKKENAKENYRPRLGCKKCKKTNTTLYKARKHYYCKDCMNKKGK